MFYHLLSVIFFIKEYHGDELLLLYSADGYFVVIISMKLYRIIEVIIIYLYKIIDNNFCYN